MTPRLYHRCTLEELDRYLSEGWRVDGDAPRVEGWCLGELETTSVYREVTDAVE